MYFRRTIADPFTDPGYRKSDSGTTITILSHTSPTGSSASYTADASAGTLRAFANAEITAWGGDEAWAIGSVNDSFTLYGLAPGTIVNITAFFTVDGTLLGSPSSPGTVAAFENAAVQARFIAGTGNESLEQWARNETEMGYCWQNGCSGFSVPVHWVSSIDLDVVAGTPFAISYALNVHGGWAYGGSGGTADFGSTGAISFTLPTGTRIASEGGYTQTAEPFRKNIYLPLILR